MTIENVLSKKKKDEKTNKRNRQIKELFSDDRAV